MSFKEIFKQNIILISYGHDTRPCFRIHFAKNITLTKHKSSLLIVFKNEFRKADLPKSNYTEVVNYKYVQERASTFEFVFKFCATNFH